MIKVPADRSQRVLKRPAGGGKWAQNAKKILNRGNEPKHLLKTKELAFSVAQNELVFQCPKRQSKLRIRLKIDDLRGIEWGRKAENGNRKLETGNWEVEIGNWKVEIAGASFQFLISNFQFLVGAKRCKLFDHAPPELLYWGKTLVRLGNK